MRIKALHNGTPLPLLSVRMTESIGSQTISFEVSPESDVRYGARLGVQMWNGSSWEDWGTWVALTPSRAKGSALRIEAIPLGKTLIEGAVFQPTESGTIPVSGNVAEVLIEAINRAKARGAMAEVSMAFTETSAAWPPLNMEVSGQQSIGSLVSSLQSAGLIAVRWRGAVMEMRLPGTPSGLPFGTGYFRSTEQEAAEANRVIARSPDGAEVTIAQNTDGLSTLGRREKAVSVGGSTPASMSLFAEAELAQAGSTESFSFLMTSHTLPPPGTTQLLSTVQDARRVLGWTLNEDLNQESLILELGSEREAYAEKLMRKAKSYDSGMGTMRLPASKALPSDGLNMRGYVLPYGNLGPSTLGGKVRVTFSQGDETIITEPLEVIERFRPVGGEYVQVVEGVVRGIVIEPERGSIPYPIMRTWMGADAQAIPDKPDGVTVLNSRWTRISMHRVIPNAEIPEGTGILELDPSIMPVIPGLAQWGAAPDPTGSGLSLLNAGAARFWGRLETLDTQLGTVIQEPVLIEQVWDGMTEVAERAVGFVNALRFPSISSPGVVRSVHLDLLVPTGAAEHIFRSGFQRRASYWQIGKEEGGIKWERGAAYRTGDITGPTTRWSSVDPNYRTGESSSGDLRLDLPGAGYVNFSQTASPPEEWKDARIHYRWTPPLLEIQYQVGGGISGTADEMGGLSFWRGNDWPGWDTEVDIGGQLGVPGTLRLFGLPGTSLVLGQFDSQALTDSSIAGVPLAITAPDGWEAASRFETSLRTWQRDEHVIARPGDAESESVLVFLWNLSSASPIYFMYERTS